MAGVAGGMGGLQALPLNTNDEPHKMVPIPKLNQVEPTTNSFGFDYDFRFRSGV
jgi:hypothetical protein